MEEIDQSTLSEGVKLVPLFCLTEAQFPWTGELCDQIRGRRTALSGKLFFDMLLEIGGVNQPAALYPPTTLGRLSRLLDAIMVANFDSMRRDCLVYYLLKQSQDGREVGYLSEKVISPFYAALMDSYWELDSGISLEGAISKIADARIAKEHTTKIMETLSLDPDSAFLIRKFVRTCRPVLREQADLERYIVANAELSIAEAWKYQRTFPISFPGRKPLLRRLLEWTVSPKPRILAIQQLLALPFSRYEESVLQDFAVRPPVTLSQGSIEAARGLVCVRLIQSSRYAAALRFDRQYPSSPAAPRGTWGAERGRIAKQVLSILPRAERDRLENEITALDADARIRSSLGSSVNMSQSWASTSLGASCSTDLGTSWEDLGRRAPAVPTKSYGGGRVRTSLANGSPAKPPPSSAPRASTASPAPAQPISEQTTLPSQNGAAPAAAGLPSKRAGPSAAPASAAHLFAEKSSSHKANGVPNGSPKDSISGRNASNAFFEAPGSHSSSPEPSAAKRPDEAPTTSPKRAQAPAARSPTPPQEEPDKPEENQREARQVSPSDDREEESSSSEDNAGDETVIVESTGPVFSIFGRGTPKQATRPAPSSADGSPGARRKFDGEGTGSQRKKPRVSLPGAFDLGAGIDDDHESEPEAPSPPVEKPHARTSTRRTPTRTMPTRTSRKRSASPDDTAEFDNTRISIPGTLYEEDEDEYLGHTNGHAKVPPVRQNGHVDEDSEEGDELPPLPKHRSTRKKDSLSGISSATSYLRTPRRTTRSVRGSSAEPDERLVPPSTGRPVRRSSRLQSTDVSPTSEHAKFDLKEKKEARPRKAKRTTGSGATAAGRGSSRRR